MEDCKNHKWIEAELFNVKEWKKEHMKEHKCLNEGFNDLSKSIWKWGVVILSFQTAVGSLAAIALWGNKMGWF